MDTPNNDSAAVLILPGLGNSGPDHWQSHWQRTDATLTRVVQDEWDAPRRADWVVRLNEAIDRSDSSPLVLVGHSSACALVAHWSAQADASRLQRIRGALLVAPSDPENETYPAGPEGFGPMPLARLAFRSVVVTSSNDAVVTLARAQRFAAAWGSELVVLEHAGHINTASGHGPWPEGLALLRSLRAS